MMQLYLDLCLWLTKYNCMIDQIYLKIGWYW